MTKKTMDFEDRILFHELITSIRIVVAFCLFWLGWNLLGFITLFLVYYAGPEGFYPDQEQQLRSLGRSVVFGLVWNSLEIFLATGFVQIIFLPELLLCMWILWRL